MFENGKFLRSEPYKKESADIKEVHRFTTPMQINGKEANALITIKEGVENGNRIYSLELQGLESTSLNPSVSQTRKGVADNAQSYGRDTISPNAIAKSDKTNSTTKEPTTHTMNRAKVL